MDATVAMTPTWLCNDKKARELLEEWTLEQLDAGEPPVTQDELKKERRKRTKVGKRRALPTSLRLANIMKYLGWEPGRSVNDKFKRMIGKELKTRKRIITAAKARDGNALIRLTGDDLELAHWAIRALTRAPGRGRKTGEPRPTDYNLEKLFHLRCAAADIKRIYEIWKRQFGFRNRSSRNRPTALSIAARRWELDENELERFRKTFAA